MNFDPTGYTWVHEHLHIDLSGFKNNLDCRLDQYDLICQEMKDLRALGVSNIIEMTNRYMGRNPQFMLDLMRDTGINVMACTGYYQDAFFPECRKAWGERLWPWAHSYPDSGPQRGTARAGDGR